MDNRNIFRTNGSISFFENVTENARPNTEYEAHAHHDEFEIYWFLEGDLSFAFEGERIPVAPGDMIVICSGQLHRPIVQSDCRYYRKRVLFRKELFSEYAPAGMELYCRLCERRILRLGRQAITDAGLDALFAGLEREISGNTPYSEFCAVTTLFYFLITAVRACAQSAERKLPLRMGKAYELIRYIDENISSDLSYKVLSEQSNISPKSLYQFFKQETGFTLGKYIKERRIIKAKSLLNAGASASEAAAAAGYKDYSVFYRNFLKETGVTPAEYAKTAGR